MTTTLRARQKDFLGGMNTAIADDSVSIAESQLLKNITLIERPNALEQISGPELFTSIDGAAEAAGVILNSIFRFYLSTGAAFTMIDWINGSTRKVGQLNGTVLTTLTLPSTLLFGVTDWAVFQNKVYFVNGTNKVFSWNGESSTIVETVLPLDFSAKVIEMYNGRAYYAGDNALPSRFIHSKALFPTQFEDLDFFDVSDSDGDTIEDLRTLGPNLIVMKTRSLHTVVGSPPQQINQNPAIGIGCVDKKTSQSTDLGLVFLSNRGVYLFQGGQPINLTEKIDTDIRILIGRGDAIFSSAFHKGVYYLFFRPTNKTVINQGYSFNLATVTTDQGIGITLLDNFRIGDSSIFDGFRDKEEWFGIQAGTNNILRVDTKNKKTFYDNIANPTTVLESEIVTRVEEMGNGSLVKELRTIFLFTHSNLVSLNVKLTYDIRDERREKTFIVKGAAPKKYNDGNLYNSGVLYGPIPRAVFELRLPAGIYANRVFMTITSDDPDEKFTLDSYEYHYLIMREV